jgi:hypothetical protein
LKERGKIKGKWNKEGKFYAKGAKIKAKIVRKLCE